MSRRFAAIKLLEHGALSLAEFHVITGWGYKSCSRVLNSLLSERVVHRIKRGTYELAYAV